MIKMRVRIFRLLLLPLLLGLALPAVPFAQQAPATQPPAEQQAPATQPPAEQQTPATQPPTEQQAPVASVDPDTGQVTMDFRDIELADLIQTVSEMTGRNFLYDETVKGKVTIISPDPMSIDQAYQLFITVLNTKGFTIVPSGRVNKIVPTREAKESNVPTYIDGRARTGEQFITRLISLQHIDATQLVNTVLAALVPKTGHVVAYPPSNALIITDSAANIERLLKIIRELDIPTTLELLEVIPLQFADAQELAQLAQTLLAQAPTGQVRRRTTPGAAQAGQEPSKILPYPRGNALVVMANAEDLAAIKALVAQLDKPPAQTHAGIYVNYLENADAEILSKTLNEIVTGMRSQGAQGARPAAARPGQPAVAGQQPLAAVAITFDKPTNSLIINAQPDDYEILKGIIDQLDIKRRQVFVEALILELSLDATQNLGTALQGAVAIDDGVAFGGSGIAPTGPSISSLTTAVTGILLGGLFNLITVDGPDGTPITVPALSALIELSKRNTDVNILSAPRLLTADNEEAEIIVGRNVPIITSRLTDQTNTAATSVTIERRDAALTLRFTPQITEGDRVRLNVFQEITDVVAPEQNVGDVDLVGPTLTKRLLRNTVYAENGKTVVLGGLINNNVTQTINKVPLLGDIPGLGWLFKRRNTIETKNNLLIFITPRIIRDSDDLDEVTRRSRQSMDSFQQGILPGIETGVEPTVLPPPLPEGTE